METILTNDPACVQENLTSSVETLGTPESTGAAGEVAATSGLEGGETSCQDGQSGRQAPYSCSYRSQLGTVALGALGASKLHFDSRRLECVNDCAELLELMTEHRIGHIELLACIVADVSALSGYFASINSFRIWLAFVARTGLVTPVTQWFRCMTGYESECKRCMDAFYHCRNSEVLEFIRRKGYPLIPRHKDFLSSMK